MCNAFFLIQILQKAIVENLNQVMRFLIFLWSKFVKDEMLRVLNQVMRFFIFLWSKFAKGERLRILNQVIRFWCIFVIHICQRRNVKNLIGPSGPYTVYLEILLIFQGRLFLLILRKFATCKGEFHQFTNILWTKLATVTKCV